MAFFNSKNFTAALKRAQDAAVERESLRDSVRSKISSYLNSTGVSEIPDDYLNAINSMSTKDLKYLADRSDKVATEGFFERSKLPPLTAKPFDISTGSPQSLANALGNAFKNAGIDLNQLNQNMQGAIPPSSSGQTTETIQPAETIQSNPLAALQGMDPAQLQILKKANEAHQQLGAMSPGIENLIQQFSSGQTKNSFNEAAAKQQQEVQAQQEVLKQLANSGLSQEQIQNLEKLKGATPEQLAGLQKMAEGQNQQPVVTQPAPAPATTQQNEILPTLASLPASTTQAITTADNPMQAVNDFLQSQGLSTNLTDTVQNPVGEEANKGIADDVTTDRDTARVKTNNTPFKGDDSSGSGSKGLTIPLDASPQEALQMINAWDGSAADKRKTLLAQANKFNGSSKWTPDIAVQFSNAYSMTGPSGGEQNAMLTYVPEETRQVAANNAANNGVNLEGQQIDGVDTAQLQTNYGKSLVIDPIDQSLKDFQAKLSDVNPQFFGNNFTAVDSGLAQDVAQGLNATGLGLSSTLGNLQEGLGDNRDALASLLGGLTKKNDAGNTAFQQIASDFTGSQTGANQVMDLILRGTQDKPGLPGQLANLAGQFDGIRTGLTGEGATSLSPALKALSEARTTAGGLTGVAEDLVTNAGDISALFTDSENGINSRLDTLGKTTAGSFGTLGNQLLQAIANSKSVNQPEITRLSKLAGNTGSAFTGPNGFNAAAADMTRKAGGLNNNILLALAGLRSGAGTDLSSVINQTGSLAGQAGNLTSGVQGQLGTLAGNVGDTLTGNARTLSDLSGSAKNATGDIQSQLAGLAGQAGSTLGGLRSSTGDLADLSGQLNTGFLNQLSGLNDQTSLRLNNFRNQFSGLADQSRGINADLESGLGELGTSAGSALGDVSKGFGSLAGQAGALDNDRINDLTGIRSNAGSRLGGLTDSAIGSAFNANTALSGISDQFEALGQRGQSVFDNASADFGNIRSGLGASVGDLSGRISSNVTSGNQALGSISSEIGGLRDRGRTAFDSAAGNFADMRSRARTGFEGLSADTAASGAGMNADLQGVSSELGDLRSRGRGMFEAGTADLNNLRSSVSGDIIGVQDQLRGISSGSGDPRFEAFRNARLNQLQNNILGQQQQQDEFFARRGLGGTSAALNAANKLRNAQTSQADLITSEIGLQELQRQDSALRDVANLAGQRASLESGLIGQGLSAGQAGLGFEQGILGQQGALAQQRFGNNQAILGRQGDLFSQGLGMESGLAGQEIGARQAGLGFDQSLLGQQGALAQQQFGNAQSGLGMLGDLAFQNAQAQSGLAGNQFSANQAGLGFQQGILGQQGNIAQQQFGNTQSAIGQAGGLIGQGAALESGIIGQQSDMANRNLQTAGNFLGQQGNVALQNAGLQSQLAGQRAGMRESGFLNQANLIGQAANTEAQRAALSSQLVGQQAGLAEANVLNRANMLGQQANMFGQEAGIRSNLAGQEAAMRQQDLINSGNLLGQSSNITAQNAGLQGSLLGQQAGLAQSDLLNQANLFGQQGNQISQRAGLLSQLLGQQSGIQTQDFLNKANMLGQQANIFAQGTGLEADLEGRAGALRQQQLANELNAINQGGNFLTQSAGTQQNILNQLAANALNMGNLQQNAIRGEADILSNQAGLQGNLANQEIGALSSLAQLDANLLGQQGNMLTQAGTLGSQLAGQQADIGARQAGTLAQLLGQDIGLQSGLLSQDAGVMGQEAQTAQGLSALISQMLGQQFDVGQGLANSQNQANQLNLEALTAGLQNLTVPAQIAISALAAENAGKAPSSSGSRGTGIFSALGDLLS